MFFEKKEIYANFEYVQNSEEKRNSQSRIDYKNHMLVGYTCDESSHSNEINIVYSGFFPFCGFIKINTHSPTYMHIAN